MRTFILCQTLHGAIFDYVEFPAWVWPGVQLHDTVEDYMEANLEVLSEGHKFYPPNYNVHGSESYRVYCTDFANPPEGFAEGQAVLAILERNGEFTWVKEIL
jgi:hypothetical protein